MHRRVQHNRHASKRRANDAFARAGVNAAKMMRNKVGHPLGATRSKALTVAEVRATRR